MSKTKKQGLRLYHGTTETIAKIAAVKGLQPYEVSLLDNGKPRAIGAANSLGICLTDVYAGFSAFDTCKQNDRWGLLEIDIDFLDSKLFGPHELYLLEKSRKKITNVSEYVEAISNYRNKIESNRKLWKDSLESLGLCFYRGEIPARAITKITIYDWKINWFVTKEIFGIKIDAKSHRSQYDRQKTVTKWLMCEPVEPTEWAIDYENSPQRDAIQTGVINKIGLDMYYQEAKKK